MDVMQRRLSQQPNIAESESYREVQQALAAWHCYPVRANALFQGQPHNSARPDGTGAPGEDHEAAP